MSKKAIYIPFSGGFDSTYMVLKTLDKYKTMIKDEDDEIDIYLITITATFTKFKFERENTARQKLITYFKTEYKGIKIHHSTAQMEFDGANLHQSGMILLPYYAFMCTGIVDLNYYDEAEIIFSTICGDQIAAYQHELKNIIYSTLAVQYLALDHPEKRVEVKFPLITKYKEEILVDLIIRDLKTCKSGIILTDACSCCEDYSYTVEDCGVCNPCRNLRSALLNIYNNFFSDKVIDSTVRQYALSIYKKRFCNTHKREKQLEFYQDNIQHTPNFAPLDKSVNIPNGQKINLANEPTAVDKSKDNEVHEVEVEFECNKYISPEIDKVAEELKDRLEIKDSYPRQVPTLGGGEDIGCEFIKGQTCPGSECAKCYYYESCIKEKVKNCIVQCVLTPGILCPKYEIQGVSWNECKGCKLYNETISKIVTKGDKKND